MISVGWGITYFTVQRSEITNVMIVGGSIYLLELAKNYSSFNESKFPVFFYFSICFEYLILYYFNMRNARR